MTKNGLILQKKLLCPIFNHRMTVTISNLWLNYVIKSTWLVTTEYDKTIYLTFYQQTISNERLEVIYVDNLSLSSLTTWRPPPWEDPRFFSFQKMRNVLKWMKNQFSDFCEFSHYADTPLKNGSPKRCVMFWNRFF